MAANHKRPLEDISAIARRLTWKSNLILALIAYVALHLAAEVKLQHPVPIDRIGGYVLKQLLITMAMFGQYILPAALLIAALVSLVRFRKQQSLYEGVALSQDIAALTSLAWPEFELLLAEYFRRCGYSVATTFGGTDGVVDMRLTMSGERYLVQCNQWRAYKVGVRPVREFYEEISAVGAAGGYFVTSGEFSAEAAEFAGGLNLLLIDGKKFLRMINDQRVPAKVDREVAPVEKVMATQ
ncbi:MAG: hypothetical protein A2X82_01420 [Geobacteraceae bacterium GWC2_55_20]|nr:MAG: hypothetical protein A2X82_01420 [Geobacteraceae bacterium GWC2_55_20]